jgi:hypothetical protein
MVPSRMVKMVVEGNKTLILLREGKQQERQSNERLGVVVGILSMSPRSSQRAEDYSVNLPALEQGKNMRTRDCLTLHENQNLLKS